LSNNKNHN